MSAVNTVDKVLVFETAVEAMVAKNVSPGHKDDPGVPKVHHNDSTSLREVDPVVVTVEVDDLPVTVACPVTSGNHTDPGVTDSADEEWSCCTLVDVVVT